MSVLASAPPRPLASGGRLRRSGRSLAYTLAGVACGAAYLVALPTVPAGGAAAVRRLLELERTVANRLLAARIPAPPPAAPEEPVAWRDLGFLAGKLPAAAAAAAACAVPAAVAVALIVLAVEGFASSGDYLGPWQLDPTLGVVLLALVLPALVVLAATADGAASLLLRTSRRGLGRRLGAGIAVREALAERLGDRTLAIAYWLPDRELFVDEHGHPVALPEASSGRSWTAVEHDGRRVAAIVHDAELEARPELVEAAAAGAVLALENEQLKADLRARLEELHASRKRIVEASVEARRHLERDLHDGAQQQLVSLSLDLQLLERRIGDGETRQLVADSRGKLLEALAELRELARGIHPALLTDRGLEPALEALAERASLPVELDLDLGGRPPPAVEAAAYFLASEALANVGKYAQASRARVSVRRRGGALHVEVEDDGIGGADAGRGSGLRGLDDRIAALDGTLAIDSPARAGTRLSATIPLERSHPGAAET